MYRAATWHALEHGVDLKNADAIARLIESAPFVCDLEENQSRITIAGIDPTNFLRDDRVNNGVSLVSSVPRVREILVKMMRDCATNHDVVMEGRDIGSVVFPGYALQVLHRCVARDPLAAARGARSTRSDRRARSRDSSRRASPLIIAEDAHVIDSSNLTIDGVVGEIIGQLKRKGMSDIE